LRSFESLEDLGRAVAAGRVAPKDQVYVPSSLAEGVSEETWARIEEALGRVGASVQARPGLASIYLLSFEELRAGIFPPAFRRDEPPS
jgi:hypothetical protein